MPTFECPICDRVTTVENKEQLPHRPFCSYRCKMIDLGRWFDGTYRVSEPTPTENELNDLIPPEDESDNT